MGDTMPKSRTGKSNRASKSDGGVLESARNLVDVREHVAAAAAILRAHRSSELERLAWVLEDSLQYLEQYERNRSNTHRDLPEFPSVIFNDDITDDQFEATVGKICK